MKIAIGADHAGYELKEKIKQRLAQEGNDVHDKGTNSTESVDYPDFARLVGEEVARKDADLGVLVCGSGIGMSIAANKVSGVRAAHVTNMYEAQMAREHNNANVVTVGSRVLDEWTAIQAVETFLHTPFRRRPPRAPRAEDHGHRTPGAGASRLITGHDQEQRLDVPPRRGSRPGDRPPPSITKSAASTKAWS